MRTNHFRPEEVLYLILLTNATVEMMLGPPDAPITNRTSPVVTLVMMVGDMDEKGRLPGSTALAADDRNP